MNTDIKKNKKSFYKKLFQELRLKTTKAKFRCSNSLNIFFFRLK